MTPAVPSSRAGPLRRRLLMLAATGLVPLLLLLALGLFHLVRQHEAQQLRAVRDLSRAMATAVDAELHSIVVLLEHMGTADELERGDLREFHQSAGRTAAQLGWRQVVLADAQGRVLLRSGDPYGQADPVAVEAGSIARVVETKAAAVSPVVRTAQLESDAFRVRVPVLRGEKLVYVLTAVLPVSRILGVLIRQNIPDDSVAAVFDQTHYRVARTPAAPSPRPSPSLQALLDRGDAQGSGRTLTREGVESHSGYTRLPGSGWVVAVGQSVTRANEALFALLAAVALGLSASLALSALLAWLLARKVIGPIDALKDGATALGRGDPVRLPPLHIVELDDVAVALTEAAAERDRAAAERERMVSQVGDALRQAEDANRSKDQFLAVLGHELRNPLAPIATAVQLMAMKGDGSTVQEQRIIDRQLRHMTRLVDDLLDVSRITSGRLAIVREPLCLAVLLAQVVEGIRPSLYQRSLELTLAPGAEAAWVAGDEVRLAQVFNNLLVNAVKFTPAGGAIRVQATVHGEQAEVAVQDTGIGMSAEEIARVFELFYQAPQSPDRARGGLGLGLPIVRSLVEMHGGSVQAASAGPGHGSRLAVRLPLCTPPPVDAHAAPADAAQGSGHVLVVDDNEDAAETCAALLELSGYTVRVAYTPQAALETLRTFTPQLAILDIGLPGMTGYALAALMKSPPHRYGGRLVALTGYGQLADIAASRGAGFDAHLTKPVSPQDLLALVERLCRPQEQAQP